MSRPVLSVRADGVVCLGDVQLWGWGFWGALKSTALFWVALMWGHTPSTPKLPSTPQLPPTPQPPFHTTVAPGADAGSRPGGIHLVLNDNLGEYLS